MFKQKEKPAEPATTPGVVFESIQPEYSVIEPTNVVDAYVVGSDNDANQTEGNQTDVEQNKNDDGHSITSQESGSESGLQRQGDSDSAPKKYCGGRCSKWMIILCVLAGVLVIALPIALVKKNDVFTRSNGDTASGQCRAPRCFTDSDCQFFGPTMEDDNGNGTSAPSSPWQCNHAVLRCANERNLMADFCPCFRDSDCINGRCEGFSVGFSTCTPLLEDDSYCNEASDCLSNRCDRPEPGKAPVCMPKISDVCGVCNEDTDCLSGECNYLVGRCANNEMFLQTDAPVEEEEVIVDTNSTTSNSTMNATAAPTAPPTAAASVIDDAGCSCLSSNDCMPQNRCDFASNGVRVCVPKAPSCGGCNENSDCESNDCHLGLFRCRNEDGIMDDKCNCLTNSDCSSDRCEALSLNPLDGFFCFPKNAACKQCNEDSDCETGKCNLLNLMCGDDQGNILDCWF